MLFRSVDLAEWLPRLQATLAECLEMLAESQEPEVFISRQRCGLCHWYSHCYALAQAQQHLSLVPGVTPSRYQSLQALGVADIQSLAAVCPVNLGEVIGREVASQLQQQAQSLIENRAMRRVTQQIRMSGIGEATIGGMPLQGTTTRGATTGGLPLHLEIPTAAIEQIGRAHV